MYLKDDGTLNKGKVAAHATMALVAFLIICFMAAAGCKEYGRYQKRADATNAVKVTEIGVEKAQQQARINRAQIEATIAEAEKRFEEAKGIKKAQIEIDKSLTPSYLQYEAIKKLPEGRAIYIPSGPQGIPLVNQVERPASP